MKRLARNSIILILAISALSIGWEFLHRTSTSSPPSQAISTDLMSGWIPYGGAWRSEGNSIIGDSEDRGPKLMNGSLNWTNYVVEADVHLLGVYGDAGIIIRSSGEEEGVDSYHGYFAGIRSMDNSFFLGRADYGWNVFAFKPNLPKIAGWYHIKALAYGCAIAAAVSNAYGLNERAYVTDPHCIAKGRFGLKSYETSAEWKNVRIGPANLTDLQNFTKGLTPTVVSFNIDVPASDYSASALDQYLDPLHREAAEHKFHFKAQPIGSLDLNDAENRDHVTVRGLVTIVRPVLYVQDSTGAILLKPDKPIDSIKVGDEVEAQGVLSGGGISQTLNHASIQPLWSDTQTLPIVVTPFELAAGRNNGRYVETDGILISESVIDQNLLLLKLENDSQEFYAVDADNATSSVRRVRPGSRLRLRGVSSSDPAFTGNLVPFAILIPSSVNIRVIGLPTWWTMTHIALLAAGLLLLAGAIHMTLIRIQHWRHEVILGERERLALEIHDTLAQSFAGIGFQLQAMRADSVRNEPVKKQLEVALDMVRRSHNEAKRSITTLGPDIDFGSDIVQSLKAVAERLSDGRSLVIEGSSHGSVKRLPRLLAETIFRVGQESIYNCIRHSGASRLEIILEIRRNTCQLIVRDNGSGFAVDPDSFGLGLRGMLRRAENASAKLEISSKPNMGTTVSLTASLSRSSGISQRSMRLLRQIFDSQARTYGKLISFTRHQHPDC